MCKVQSTTWFETWCSTWWAFNTAAAEFDAVLKNQVEGSDMRRQSNAVKPIVTALAILPHRLPCSIMILKRATGMGLKLSTRRIAKQINSHLGTLYYWHSVHSPDYQWYLPLEVWEGGCQPPCLLDARESRDDGLGCRCTVHQLAAHKPRCTSFLRPALQLHPEPLFSATRPKVSPSLVPPAKRIISNDLAGGLAAAVSLLLSACPNSWLLPPLDPD